MTVHVHDLFGCEPAPLAHYLKALGVLRLVAEQADPDARLQWQDEHARLSTRLSRAQLVEFFSQEYRPTPVLAPWNGGSGFYPKDNRTAIDTIAASRAARFDEFRSVIALSRSVVGTRSERPSDEDKQAMLAHLRRSWRAGAGAWLQAAVVLDTNLCPSYPSLLGTGGNDGRLDFTNNFMQRLVELFDLALPDAPALPTTPSLFEATLFGERPAMGLTQKLAIGQFLPGAAGGANGSNGAMAESLVNPCDFVLMIEGAVIWSAALTRRADTEGLPSGGAPFALRAQAVGHGSAAAAEGSPRGELWAPLWSRAASLREISALLREARLNLADGPATRPVEAARALATLGTTRGISAFQRYGFLERNGQANLAVPLGRWRVEAQPAQQPLDHAAIWIERLARASRGDRAPQAWQVVTRRCEEALLSCSRNGHDRKARLLLLLALGEAEEVVGRIPRRAREAHLRPLSRLPASWLETLDVSAELRLASAIASQQAVTPSPSLRAHFVALDGREFSSLYSPEGVATANELVRDSVAVLRRRLLHPGGFNLAARPGFAVGVDEIAAFLNGQTDDSLIWGLVRPLLALDWRNQAPFAESKSGLATIGILGPYAILRLTHLAATPPGAGEPPKTEPAVIARLASGDLPRALAIATRRLRAMGLRPNLGTAIAELRDARRLAAGLLIPLSAGALRALSDRVVRAYA